MQLHWHLYCLQQVESGVYLFNKICDALRCFGFLPCCRTKDIEQRICVGIKIRSNDNTSIHNLSPLHCTYACMALQPTVNTEQNERSRFGHECFVMLVLKWLIKVYHKIGDAIQYKTATTTTMVAVYSIGLALPELGSLGLGLAWI